MSAMAAFANFHALYLYSKTKPSLQQDKKLAANLYMELSPILVNTI